MGSWLTLSMARGTAVIPAAAQPRLLYVLLEVRPGGDGPGQRLPLNLGLVVDVSRSMQVPIVTEEQFEWLARQGHAREVMVDGLPVWHIEQAPIEFAAGLPTSQTFVREALATVSSQLRAGDRSALIAFASEGQVVATGLAGPLPAAVLDALGGLDLGEETWMARGLSLGLEEVQRRGAGPDSVNRVLILTDGFTLDEDECRALAYRARQAGIAISTLGLGIEFNEELLIPLAEASGGHAYLIQQPEEIPGVFVEELQRAEAVIYRNVEIKLQLTPGVELRRAVRVSPAIGDLGEVSSEGGSANLFLGDLEWDAPPAVLLELIAPPRPAGSYRLCQVVLAYDDPAGPAAKVRQDVVVEYGSDPAVLAARPDPRVMNIVVWVTAFRLQTQALAQAAAGDLAGATVKLRAAATRLLDMGEPALAQSALQEADNLERRGQLSPADRKRMRYTTRRLTQPLGPGASG